MSKTRNAVRKAEGWQYVGLWLDPSDVAKLDALKKRLGYVESAPLFRRLLNDTYAEASKK